MIDVDELNKVAGIAAKKFLERHGGDFDDAKSEVVVFLLSLGASDLGERRAYYVKAGINRLVDVLRRERHVDWKDPPRVVELTDAATDETPERELLTREDAALKRQTVCRTLQTFGNPNGNWRRDRQIVAQWTAGNKQTTLAKKYGVSKQRINQIVMAFRRACRSILRG